MSEKHRKTMPREDVDWLDLLERIGVPKVADALGILPSGVRQWRQKGVPEGRKDALLKLAADEGLLSPAVHSPAGESDDIGEAVVRRSSKEKLRELATSMLALRQPPPSTGHRKSVRLNRRTVLLVCGGMAAALALGTTQGLRSIAGNIDPANVERQEPALIFQPVTAGTIPEFSYTDVTRQESTVIVTSPEEPKEEKPEPRRSRPDPDVARLAQEEAEALRSPLFPSGALALRQNAPTAGRQQRQLAGLDGLNLDLPSPADFLPGRQRSAAEQREAFLDRQPDDGTYLRNGVQKPLSDYEIKAGTVIPAALITGLNSDLPGEITGQVTEHVYDTVTGRHLLIPQGTRIFGRYNADVAYAQERAQIVWDRLIMPNGDSLELEAMVGTDKAGQAGLADQVDHHLGRLIGAVILSSFISVGANLATDSGNDVTDALGDAAAQQAAQVGGRIVDRQLDVQPTITIRPGFRLNILVNKDMLFPEPYEGA